MKKFNPLHSEFGLGKLAKEYLNIELDKKDGQLHRHWGDYKLKVRNVKYAANDAHAGIELFKIFREKLKPTDNNSDDPNEHLQLFIDEYCREHFDVGITKQNKMKVLPTELSFPI